MKTEKASSKGSEPESPTPPPAANHSEASSSSTHTDEARPTDRPSRIVSIVAPILEEAVQRCQNEIKISSKRLEECKVISDRLRALVTAMFYSQAGQHDTTNAVLGPRKQPAIHPTTRQFLGKQPPSGFASSSAAQSQSEGVRMPATKAVCSAPATFSASTAALLNSNGKRSHPDRLVPANPFSQPPEMLEGGRDSRHKFKKSVIFGNVSRYLNPERNTDTDGCTFKWKIYLALDKKECGRIEDFVERVTFYLHSSYCPHVISLSKPPFELTKRGWGEFKVRADLSFWDKRNPAKSIYHQLKFSSVESKFGVQLKQETVHVLELFREVPVGVFPSSACPKVGEKRNAPDTSEGVSHVTIAHNSSPPVKIKKENEEPEQVAMKACASRGSTGMASTSASPSNPFKTPLVVKTEPVLPGSPGSPNAAAVSRNSVKIGSTGGISMLSSQGQSLILGTILPPVVSQTASSMNGVAMNTVVLSNGGLGAPRGKMLSAGTSSMLGPRIASQSQPRQISLLKGLPPTSSSGAGVTVVLPAPGKTGLQNSPSRAQTTLPFGHFIINSGSAVLGRTYSPVSAANVTLAPSGIRSSGKELHFIQQPLTAGNGSPLILLKTDSKVFSPGSTSTENKARTGASLVTASSSAKPTMLVFNSASGVQKSIPIQIITTKSITIAGTVSTPSLPIVTCVPSTASASGVKQGAVPKPVETWGLLGGTTCAKSNVFSPAAPSPVRKANSGSVPLPCGGGGSGGTLLPGESDEAMIDVVSCTADDSPAASNPMPETCRGSSKLSEAALSSHSSKLLGRGSVSSSPGVCSSQSSSLPSESSTADAGGVVTLAASIPTASPAKDVLTGAVSSTVLTTVVSRTMSSLASHVPVSAGQTVTCLSTPESGVVSKAASAASPKLCTPSQFISIPSSSLHRAAVPGCSNIGQSNPLMTVLSSSSSSPSLSSSPHPPKAAYIVVKGNPSTASKMDASSLRQSSTGVPAMRPFKVTPQGLKMVTSQPPTHTAAMVLTSGTNSVTGPKTVTLTFPIAEHKGLPQAVGRTPPTSQNR